MKYVIIRNQLPPGKGKPLVTIVYPVIFTEALNHCDMVPEGYEAVSAGFCDVVLGTATVHSGSKSESLNVKSLPQDATFIQTWIDSGESLLVMASSLYDDVKPKEKKCRTSTR